MPQMTVGQRIKAARLAMTPPMSVRTLARRVKLAESTLYDLERGDSCSTMKLHRIAEELKVNIDWLETGRGPKERTASALESPEHKYEFAVRVKGPVLSAGNGAMAWEHEEVDGSHAFTKTWVQRKGLDLKECRILDVSGDSMGPHLQHGYVVLIDTSDRLPIKSGKIYALMVGGELRIKRLFRLADGSLKISSDNENKALYPDEIVPPEHLDGVTIIGRKRWHSGDDD